MHTNTEKLSQFFRDRNETIRLCTEKPTVFKLLSRKIIEKYIRKDKERVDSLMEIIKGEF